jgi:acyl-CoA reductase-like NAD-dependent aldehyde dehydrogenase
MASEQTLCHNPATFEVLGHSDLNSPADVTVAVEAAREAQKVWSDLTAKERSACLMKIRDYLVDAADELAEVIARDNGKTRTDAMVAEVVPATLALTYYCRKGALFLKDRRLMPASWLLANKASKIVRVPYGVVGIISPWNYPFAIPFSEVIMALMAGNAVILKVATETQMVGRALERCIHAADLPPGLFTHVNLPGRLAGDAFLDAGVDKLFFTGSVAVGKSLMARAAQSLTPLVLELGGNDPMLVCEDADIRRAAAGALWGGLTNCGQTCGGVERIYVHRCVYPDFLAELKQRVENLRIGYDTRYQTDIGAMTTAKQMRAVQSQVEAAVAAGAVICARNDPAADLKGNFQPALVLTEVDHSMDVMRHETFGPVLGVMPVEDMEQAVSLANDSDLGLTASVWTTNTKVGEQLARRIQAGVVTINDHLISHGLAETPWGGFKQSGIGRSHGAIGMAEMTQPQCLVHDHLPWVKRNMWWYPSGQAIYKGMRGILDMRYGPKLLRRFRGLMHFLRMVPRMFW